jgi:hypothetical protein
MSELEMMDWPVFARALSLPQLSQLRTVHFLNNGCVSLVQVKDMIMAKLLEFGVREISVICSFLHYLLVVLRLIYFSQEHRRLRPGKCKLCHEGLVTLVGDLGEMFDQLRRYQCQVTTRE